MDANVSTMTMPKTMPVQNLLRYISFKIWNVPGLSDHVSFQTSDCSHIHSKQFFLATIFTSLNFHIHAHLITLANDILKCNANAF